MPRSILVIAITTLVTIIAWSSFEVVRAINTTELSDDVQRNTAQKSYSFKSEEEFIKTTYLKNVTIKYTRDNLNDQGK